LTPDLGDGSLAVKTFPHFFPENGRNSPKIPQNGLWNFLVEEFYNVPNLRTLREKMPNFERNLMVPLSPARGAIFLPGKKT